MKSRSPFSQKKPLRKTNPTKDYVMRGTPEYNKAFKEGTFANVPNQLDEVVIYSGNDYKNQPNYNNLTKEERRLSKGTGVIARSLRAKARGGKEVKLNPFNVMGYMGEETMRALQIPQSLAVEGVEALRGNDYSFKNAVTAGKQRLPSETIGFEDKPGWDLGGSVNTAMDVVLDPSNLLGVGFANKLMKGSKALIKGSQSFSNKFVKNFLKDVKPNAKSFDAVTTVNPLSKSQAQNLAKQGRDEEIFLKYKESANTIDEFVKSYIKDLTSPEGFKRLVNQEADYLRSIGFDEVGISSQARVNAGARINEISNIGNINRSIVDGGESVSSIINNPYSFNNSSFSANKDYFSDLFFKPGESPGAFNVTKTKIGGKVLPGKTRLGTMHSKSKPVAAHEIGGHGLQSGRKLPVDINLKKLEPLEKMDEATNKAYTYFMQGSSGKEPSAFLHGLRQAMLDNKMIKNRYDHISPAQLERFKTMFDLKPSGTLNTATGKFRSDTRILDFIKPNKKNFSLLSRELNKLPAVVPVGAAVGTGAALSQGNNEIRYE